MTVHVRQKLGATTIVLALLAFGAAVMASNVLLRGWRLDLTENGLYTLAPGTRSLLQSIEEPINLYLFFSDQGTENLPALRAYASRVRETLEEFAALAPEGRLVLNVIDPLPFSEEEDRAEQYGLQAANIGPGGEAVYFGLAGSNSVGGTDSIPFFQPDPTKEAFLEYDLARLVYNLANPDKTVVGLLTSAPIQGGFDPQTQQPSQPWVIVEQAKQLFDIRALPASTLRIEDDVDVLWVVHPAELDQTTLYAIDQFVLRGGRALIFLDPVAEILSAAAGPTGFGASPSSTLEPLLTTWGVQYAPTEVVADERYALNIRSGARTIRHVGLLGLDADAMNKEDIVTSGLGTLNLGIPGHFTLVEGATATLTPLLTSSDDAAVMTSDRFQFLPDPGELLNGFAATGTKYVLAARLEGAIKSAFPDGPPAAPDREAPVDAELGAQHIASIDSANVILVGDVDMLSDRLWVQVQSFLGQRLVTAFANNGDFVISALDNLSGSADLIGLRSRATYTRPFTTVEELRREADARFRATEQQLQAELADTERKLGDLQAARNDTSSLLMSPEQQEEIQRFLDEQLRIRQELRSVRRELDRDIDSLGTRLQIINMVAVPILVTAFALGVVVWRRRRKAPR
jgi:gliding motility-associatede transport system auxiliary component